MLLHHNARNEQCKIKNIGIYSKKKLRNRFGCDGDIFCI